MLASAILNADETPVRVLDTTLDRRRQGYFWVYIGDGERLPESELERLLPDHWLREHPEAYLDYRVRESDAAAQARRQR